MLLQFIYRLPTVVSVVWSIRMKTCHLPQSWRQIPAMIVSHVLIDDEVLGCEIHVCLGGKHVQEKGARQEGRKVVGKLRKQGEIGRAHV